MSGRSSETSGGRAKRSSVRRAERSTKQLRVDRDSRDRGGIGRRDSGPRMGRLGDHGDHRSNRSSREYRYCYGGDRDANNMDDKREPRRLPSRIGGQQNDYGKVLMRRDRNMLSEREIRRADRDDRKRRDGDRRGSEVL